MKMTYEVAPGLAFPVIGQATIVNKNGQPTGQTLPVVDVPMVSDYIWQLNALNDRLQHPERYEQDENLPETINRLKSWLKAHTSEREKAII